MTDFLEDLLDLTDKEIDGVVGGSGFLPPDVDNPFRREFPDWIWT